MVQQLLTLEVLNFSCTLKAGPTRAVVPGVWQPCSDERSGTVQLEQAPRAALIFIPELVICLMSETDMRGLWQHMVVASGRFFKP